MWSKYIRANFHSTTACITSNLDGMVPKIFFSLRAMRINQYNSLCKVNAVISRSLCLSRLAWFSICVKSWQNFGLAERINTIALSQNSVQVSFWKFIASSTTDTEAHFAVFLECKDNQCCPLGLGLLHYFLSSHRFNLYLLKFLHFWSNAVGSRMDCFGCVFRKPSPELGYISPTVVTVQQGFGLCEHSNEGFFTRWVLIWKTVFILSIVRLLVGVELLDCCETRQLRFSILRWFKWAAEQPSSHENVVLCS